MRHPRQLFIDSRFTAPLATSNTNFGYPGSDFIFDPRVITYTGRLLYDKIVSSDMGIGTSVASGTALDGVRVELQRTSDGGFLKFSYLYRAPGRR